MKTDLRNRISILETDGVGRFVQVGEHLSSIPEEQIEWIRIVIGHPKSVKRERFLSGGERVKVTGGPFTDVEGIVLSVRGSKRVVISLDCIAQAVSVEVAPEVLKRIG